MTTPGAKKVPLRIRLPFATTAEFIERYGPNVSRGSIFIATRASKPAGTLLSFELVLVDGTRLMRGEGLVHEVSVDEHPGKSGMLLRFTRIDAGTKALIDEIHARRDGAVGAQVPPVAVAEPTSPTSAPLSEPLPVAALKQAPPTLANDVVLGIDFGTTTCRAAICVDGAVRLLTVPSELGIAVPSVVTWDATRQKLLVGSPALRHAAEFPNQSAVGFKRLIGRRASSLKVKELIGRFAAPVVADSRGDAGVELGGRVSSVPELTALLFELLKDAAQHTLGQQVTRAVLCVPAGYSESQRRAIVEAGRLAGLQVLRILNEPSAVALAFGNGRGLARKRVLVYDLGGGSFAVSVVELTGDDLEVVSTGGDNFLGGLDFDLRLAHSLIAALPDGPRGRLLESPTAVERVREASERAKIALSEGSTAHVHVQFATTDDSGSPMDLRSDVERNFLEQKTADLIEHTIEVTRTVLEAARLTPQSLDEVLVVGGQSRAPSVLARLEQYLGKSARTDVDPQGAVAMGAALLGHSLVLAERGKRGVSLSEVLSAPIGIAVRGGGMRRILERNTRLPAEKSLTIPVKAGEPVHVAVFQGAADQAADNEHLGSLTVTPERAGGMDLQFQVTSDGRLALSGTAPGTKTEECVFSAANTSASIETELLTAPLPVAEARPSEPKGLFGGIKRLFGR